MRLSSNMVRRRAAAALLAAASLAAGCGAGGVAEQVRPNPIDVNRELGAGDCRGVDGFGDPLIVDWRPDHRGALEVAMRDGVAVVHYDCGSIRLLQDCRVGGTYGFAGMNRKEQVVQLENAEEIRANLPFAGAGIAGRISGELERGASLDVAMIMIGRRSTTRLSVARDEMEGRCDGATHFVRRALVGAFAMSTGTRARVSTVAELFSAGASAKSSSSKHVANRDGDLEACKKASSESSLAPDECGALLRLELAPIARPAKDDADPTSTCPQGYVRAQGKCTKPAATVHECDGKDIADCRAQCDKGSAASCYAVAMSLENAKPYDPVASGPFFQHACELGHQHACAYFGASLLYGLRGIVRDTGRARALFEKGCRDGDALACFQLGVVYHMATGVPADYARAAALYERACNAGKPQACGNLGIMYDHGNGFAVDGARAVKLYERACDGELGIDCRNAAISYRDGTGIPKDEARAQLFFRRAAKYYSDDCAGDETGGCAQLGAMYARGETGTVDLVKAAELFARGCEGGSGDGCWRLGAAYAKGAGVVADVARAASLFKRACDLGDNDGCTTLAQAYVRGDGVPKDFDRAVAYFGAACDKGFGAGCAGLGNRYDQGEGVPKDARRAAELWQKACDLDHAGGCTSLGFAYDTGAGVPKDPVRANEFYRRGCAAGSLAGCHDLAMSLRDGDGVAKDVAKAAELFKRACDGDYANACSGLAELHRDGALPGGEQEATALFQKACDLGDGVGCRNVGIRFRYGRGATPDPIRAAAAYKRGCELGEMMACNGLGDVHEKGDLGKPDYAQAMAYYTKACEGGAAIGCSGVGDLYFVGKGVPRSATRAIDAYRRACRGGHAGACDKLRAMHAQP